MTTTELISIMVERIVGRFQPIRILLFGSQARGDADESSDVDLLVIMKDIPNRHRAAVEIRRVLKDLPIGKDIVVATPDEIDRRRHAVGNIISAALQEGKIIYEQR